jgi:YhcH/YjgK/YiaL family protein
VARGVERIGVSPIGQLAGGEYDDKKDVTWLTGTGDFITLDQTRFIILWPGDAHMPGIAAGVPAEVRKVVIKIAVD